VLRGGNLHLYVQQLQSTIQLRLEDAVLDGQILVPRQQFLVHRPRHVGKDARPIHKRPLPCSYRGDSIMGLPQNWAGPPQALLSDAA